MVLEADTIISEEHVASVFRVEVMRIWPRYIGRVSRNVTMNWMKKSRISIWADKNDVTDVLETAFLHAWPCDKDGTMNFV